MMSKGFLSCYEVVAVVIERDNVRVLSPLNAVDAIALQGCAAEDPVNWDDIAIVWRRYRHHPDNAEFADSLPVHQTDRESVLRSLAQAPAWLVLDLVHKRVFTGGEFPLLRLRHTPIDEDGPLTQTVVLPPWWELRQHVEPLTLNEDRLTPLSVPNPRRDVLWGLAVTRFFAKQMLKAASEGTQWIGSNWENQPCGDFQLTLEIHRDWLMTPRDDLGGGIPRDCLHGGMEWIDDLAGGQTFRVYQDEAPLPISTDLCTYESAPFGRHEVILYFDACRDTIGTGWQWLLADRTRVDDPQAEQNLAEAMSQFLKSWLISPFEGGRPPQEIIRCDRLRIPLVSNGDDHIIDCDCPICDMMATGEFGPSISGFDGHTLEVDGEFAFSIHATREAWEAEQREWEEMNARIEADMEKRKEQGEENDDPFASAWSSGLNPDARIPGDTGGHLGMAFLVADLVSSLKSENAPQADVDRLNAAFREYRTSSSPSEIVSATESFKQTLEELATRHSELVSRSADLQSRIEERLRSTAVDDLDIPY